MAGSLGTLAGCSGLLGPAEPKYTCTQLADESTTNVSADATPIPFAFEYPSVMSEESRVPSDRGGTVRYNHTWSRNDPNANGRLNQELRLVLRYFPGGDFRPPFLGSTVQARVLGKRTFEGDPVGVFRLDDSPYERRLRMFLPRTVDRQLTYDRFELVTEASFEGREERRKKLQGGDEAACTDSLVSVTTAVLDSIPEIEPADSETTVSLSPSSATVQRGGSVELTVDVGGAKWVDLAVGNRETSFNFSGSVRVPEDSFSITIAPPTSERGADVVSTEEGVRLVTIDSVGEFTAGAYPVRLGAPGASELVTATTELTVNSAR
jgi:hypothetical protein